MIGKGIHEHLQKQNGETIDQFANGAVKILQKKTGYRFSLDAVLLASFVRIAGDERLIDIGTGSGVIALILARRFPDIEITGIEIQEQMAAMAARNAAINDLSKRINILCGDARELGSLFGPSTFDAVIFNPPYRKISSGRLNAVREKAMARHEVSGSLRIFLDSARSILTDGGKVFCIYPARRGVELLTSMRSFSIEPKRMRIVYSHCDGDGEFMLVEGTRGGGEELKILYPLVIYRSANCYTDEMQGIFKNLVLPVSNGDSKFQGSSRV